MQVDRVPKLHVITDETVQSRYSHIEIAHICTDAGADCIQYREKRDLPFKTHVENAAAMLRICEQNQAMLVINDHVGVAAKVGVQGVHVGQEDEHVPNVRARLGSTCLIGATANSLTEAKEMNRSEADYLGVGPVFGTNSKESPAKRLGLDGLKAIVDCVEKPVIAIGNIQLASVEEVMNTGAAGVAVISAVLCTDNLAEATAAFCGELRM